MMGVSPIPGVPVVPAPTAQSSSPSVLPRARRGVVAAVALAALVVGTAAPASARDADDPASIEEGAVLYETNCAGCHGPDGEGTGFGRSLIGLASQQPDRSVHVASVANGIRNMPEFASSLSADEIDAVVSFVRLSFVAEQADDAEEEREELPRTGGTSTLAVLGSAMLGAGLLLDRLGRRTVPIRR